MKEKKIVSPEEIERAFYGKFVGQWFSTFFSRWHTGAASKNNLAEHLNRVFLDCNPIWWIRL